MDTPASDVKTDQAVVNDTSTHSWRDALPVELRGNELIKGFQKPGELVTDYLKVKGESANAIRIPGEGASVEERNAYYAKLGRPEKPEGYEFTKPEGLPDEMFNPKLATDFAQFLHEKGAPKSLAQDIYKFYNQMVVNGYKSKIDADAKELAEERQASEAAINKLKDEWKGDAFNANTTIAVNAFKKFTQGNADAMRFLEAAKVDNVPIGNHPLFLKLFYEIGLKTKDDSAFIRNSGASVNPADTDEARANAMFPSMVKKAG